MRSSGTIRVGLSRAVITGVLGLLVILATAPVRAQSEDTLKSQFILNFARFTTWPSTAFASPSSPLVEGEVEIRHRLLGDSPTARFRPRKCRGIEQEHRCSLLGGSASGGGAGRSTADDNHIVGRLHTATLRSYAARALASFFASSLSSLQTPAAEAPAQFIQPQDTNPAPGRHEAPAIRLLLAWGPLRKH